jgi:hypothetical protein
VKVVLPSRLRRLYAELTIYGTIQVNSRPILCLIHYFIITQNNSVYTYLYVATTYLTYTKLRVRYNRSTTNDPIQFDRSFSAFPTINEPIECPSKNESLCLNVYPDLQLISYIYSANHANFPNNSIINYLTILSSP